MQRLRSMRLRDPMAIDRSQTLGTAGPPLCARFANCVFVNNQTGKADDAAFPNDDHRAAAKTGG